MDAFESVVSRILEKQGYWTQLHYYVELSKVARRRIGKPSMPRHELDIIGYHPKDNRVAVVECKSFLNSTGVRFTELDSDGKKESGRYKLFTHWALWREVKKQLKRQLIRDGLCLKNPTIELWLIAGKVRTTDREPIQTLFKRRGWVFKDVHWLKLELEEIARGAYEDDVLAVVAKLLSVKTREISS